MSIPSFIEKTGSGLVVTMDDGTRYRAVETPGDSWRVSHPVTDPPPTPLPPSSERFIWPFPLSAVNPVVGEYGPRWGRIHGGMDFAQGPATNGANIIASANGTVWLSGWHGAFGNAVIIDHGQGLMTLYGHMQNGSLKVSKGQSVAQGAVLGALGSTGNSTGPHLHFETHEGGYRYYDSAKNPRIFIPKWNAL